jgi:hypothetical protein
VALEEHERHTILIKISLNIDRERSIFTTLVVWSFRSVEVKEVREGKVCRSEKVWGYGECEEQDI